jgi:hypothetical protein
MIVTYDRKSFIIQATGLTPGFFIPGPACSLQVLVRHERDRRGDARGHDLHRRVQEEGRV